MMFYWNIIDKKNRCARGFSLIEILVLLIMFSSVMISGVGIILRSTTISINNDIADRANTVLIRVLELSKKADQDFKDCEGESILLEEGGYYSIGSIDFVSQGTDSVCIDRENIQESITTCAHGDSGTYNAYKTNIVFPDEGYVEFKEEYCMQLIVSPTTNPDYSKITMNIVFDDLSDNNIKRTVYVYQPK